MPTGRDTEIRAAVHKAAQTAEPALPLRHGGPAGLADVRRRAAAARPRRRWGLAASLCLAVLVGLGGVAVAREPFDDPTNDVFSELHPDRSDSDTVEPHTLAGEMTLADGTQVRLHVTTATGPGSCGSVGRFSSGGRSEGTVGFCRDLTTALIDVMNGAAVGYTPNDRAATATVTVAGEKMTVAVVHRYYLVPSEDVRPGTEIAVTLFDANRKPLDHPTILVAQ